MTAVAAAAGGGQGGVWAAYPGCERRLARRRGENSRESETGSGGMEGGPAL